MDKHDLRKMKFSRISSSEDFVIANEELIKRLIEGCDRYNVSYEKIVACIEGAYKDGAFNETLAKRLLKELERTVYGEERCADVHSPSHAELWNVAYDCITSVINNFQRLIRGGRSVGETYREIILSYSKLLDYHQSEIAHCNQQLKLVQDKLNELEDEVVRIQNENIELKRGKESLENDLAKPKIEDRFHLLLKIIQRMIGYSANADLWGNDEAKGKQEIEWFRDDVSQLERELLRNGLKVIRNAKGYEKFFIQVQDDNVQDITVTEPLIMRGDTIIENGQINIPPLNVLPNNCSDSNRLDGANV